MFRVGCCQYKKKSYFYLSLFTVSYNIITIHRRNICDKIFYFLRRFGLFFSRSSNWRAKRQDFQVTTSPKVGKLQGVKRCKKLSRFQLACRLPLESLKIFPFSNLTRNFFRGEKEEMVDGCNLLKPLARQQQWQHCARATCNASEQPLFFKNTW